MAHITRDKIKRLTFGLMGLAVFLLAFQNCTGDGSQVRFGGREESTSAAHQGGGNGEPFEGKPQLGTYYRVIPNLSCAGQPAVYGKIIVEESGLRAEFPNPIDCQPAHYKIELSQLSHRLYNPDLLGWGDGVFERAQSVPAVNDPKLSVADALCRRPQKLGTPRYDLLFRFNKAASSASGTLYMEALSPSGNAGQLPTPLAGVTRNVKPLQIVYANSDFEVVIDRTSGQDAAKLTYPARVKGKIQGNVVDEALECRLAGVIDQQVYPLKTPEPAPTTRILFADSFESGDFSAGWTWVIDWPGDASGTRGVLASAASSFGLPIQNQSQVASFTRPLGDTSEGLAWIQKVWGPNTTTDSFGRKHERLPNDNPSAIYSAWYFVPTSYIGSDTELVGIFSFNEQGIVNGQVESRPSWNISMGKAPLLNQTGQALMMGIWHYGADMNTYRPKAAIVPLGRWFEIRAHLYEGDRIDYFIDGVLHDTALNSVYPVGRSFAQHDAWLWSLGHGYGTGQLFIDNCVVREHP